MGSAGHIRAGTDATSAPGLPPHPRRDRPHAARYHALFACAAKWSADTRSIYAALQRVSPPARPPVGERRARRSPHARLKRDRADPLAQRH